MTQPLPTTCLVLERGGRWTAAVRRLAADCRATVRRIASWSLCGERLTESPDSVVFVELHDSALADGLRRLAEGREVYPRAAWIVVGDEQLARWQWLAREAGAVDVLLATSHVPRVRSVLERHARRRRRGRSSLEQRVAQLLPWPELAELFRIVNPAERSSPTGLGSLRN